jgi:hypothetical protein
MARQESSASNPYMVKSAEHGCFLANPLDFFGPWGKFANVMHFADNLMSRFDLCGQEDHSMTAITNSPIRDDISVLEELGACQTGEGCDTQARLTFASCR